jgi:hypothetical protein
MLVELCDGPIRPNQHETVAPRSFPGVTPTSAGWNRFGEGDAYKWAFDLILHSLESLLPLGYSFKPQRTFWPEEDTDTIVLSGLRNELVQRRASIACGGRVGEDTSNR